MFFLFAVGPFEMGKVRAVMKRPPIKKNTPWKHSHTSATLTVWAPRGTHTDQMRWKRSLPELLQAFDDILIKKLIADKILPNLKGNTCPRCEAGTLSGLVEHGGSYAHRCNNSLCHVRINPHNLHPLSTDGGETRQPGSGSRPACFYSSSYMSQIPPSTSLSA